MSALSSYAKPILNSHRESILAALPFLFFGSGIAASAGISAGPYYTISLIRFMASLGAFLLPSVTIAVIGLYALLKRMPDWSLTWVGSGYMGLLLLIKTLSEELADTGRFILSPYGDIFLTLTVLLAGVVLISWAAQRSWQHAGLFSVGMAGMLGLSLIMGMTVIPFNRHDLALLGAPVGLILAALTYGCALRSGATRQLMWTVFGLLNIITTILLNRVWQTSPQMQAKASPLWPLLILVTAALLSGPMLGVVIHPIRNFLHRALNRRNPSLNNSSASKTTFPPMRGLRSSDATQEQ